LILDEQFYCNIQQEAAAKLAENDYEKSKERLKEVIKNHLGSGK